MRLRTVDGAVVGLERKELDAANVDAVLADGAGILEGVEHGLYLGVCYLRYFTYVEALGHGPQLAVMAVDGALGHFACSNQVLREMRVPCRRMLATTLKAR